MEGLLKAKNPERLKEMIYLTSHQCNYLGGQRKDGPATDCFITAVSEDGWIFVEERHSVGDEGSGVWVSPDGEEQYG